MDHLGQQTQGEVNIDTVIEDLADAIGLPKTDGTDGQIIVNKNPLDSVWEDPMDAGAVVLKEFDLADGTSDIAFAQIIGLAGGTPNQWDTGMRDAIFDPCEDKTQTTPFAVQKLGVRTADLFGGTKNDPRWTDRYQGTAGERVIIHAYMSFQLSSAQKDTYGDIRLEYDYYAGGNKENSTRVYVSDQTYSGNPVFKDSYNQGVTPGFIRDPAYKLLDTAIFTPSNVGATYQDKVWRHNSHSIDWTPSCLDRLLYVVFSFSFDRELGVDALAPAQIQPAILLANVKIVNYVGQMGLSSTLEGTRSHPSIYEIESPDGANSTSDQILVNHTNDGDVRLYTVQNIIDQVPTPNDQLVKISATDTTSDYLNSKVSLTAPLKRTVLNPSGNEVYQVEIDMNSVVNVTPETADKLIIRDDTDGAVKNVTITDVLALSGAAAPDAIVDIRPPLADDQGTIGQHWIDSVSDRVYVLTEKNGASGDFPDGYNFWREVSFNQQDSIANALTECLDIEPDGNYDQLILYGDNTIAAPSTVWSVGLKNSTIFTIEATQETFIIAGDRTNDYVQVFKRVGLTNAFSFLQTLQPDDSIGVSEFGNTVFALGTNTSAFIGVMDRNDALGDNGNAFYIYRFNSTSGLFEPINIFHKRATPAPTFSFPPYAQQFAFHKTWGKGSFERFTDTNGNDNIIVAIGDIQAGATSDGRVYVFEYNATTGQFDALQTIESLQAGANPFFSYELSFIQNPDDNEFYLGISTRWAGGGDIFRAQWNSTNGNFDTPSRIIDGGGFEGDTMELFYGRDNTGTLHGYLIVGNVGFNQFKIFRDNNTINWNLVQQIGSAGINQARVTEVDRSTLTPRLFLGTYSALFKTYIYDNTSPLSNPFIFEQDLLSVNANTLATTYNNGDFDPITQIIVASGTDNTVSQGFIEVFIPKKKIINHCPLDMSNNNIINLNEINGSSVLTPDSVATFTNKTIDADATGNSITNLDDGSIKAGANIDASKLGTGVISNTELNLLNNLTSLYDDSKLKVSSNDTTQDYLQGKVSGVNGVNSSVFNEGVSEELRFNLDINGLLNTETKFDNIDTSLIALYDSADSRTEKMTVRNFFNGYGLGSIVRGESLSQSSTLGTTFLQKLRITTPAIIGNGSFILFISYYYGQTADKKDIEIRVQQDDATDLISVSYRQDGSDATFQRPHLGSGYSIVTLNDGNTYDFDLDFRSGTITTGGTALISNVRMSLFRIT